MLFYPLFTLLKYIDFLIYVWYNKSVNAPKGEDSMLEAIVSLTVTIIVTSIIGPTLIVGFTYAKNSINFRI